jgi:hypothetical protein
MTKPKPKPRPLYVHLTPDLRRRLDARCLADSRNVSAVVRLALMAYLQIPVQS